MNTIPLVASLFACTLAGSSPAQQAVVRLQTTTPAAGTAYDCTGPLAVRVELVHPADLDDTAPTAPISIGTADRPWAEAVHLTATGVAGQPLAWEFTRSASPQPGPFELRRGAPGRLGFLLAADAQRTVPPGGIVLQAAVAGAPAAISLPLQLAIAAPAPATGALQLGLLGGTAIAPGDPWVFTLTLAAPVFANENALRGDIRTDGCHAEAYTWTLRDPHGRVVATPFDLVAAPSTLPDSAALRTHGFGPVLAVLAPATTAAFAPGTWQLAVQWQAGERGEQRRGELDFVVHAGAHARSLAERPAAELTAQLGHAQALCWHGEFGNAAHVERRAGEAAAVLHAAEQLAQDHYAARADAATAGALAQLYALQGEFAAARPFARLAAGHAGQTTDVRPLLAEIERQAQQRPGRFLPRLRALLAADGVAAAVPAPTTPTTAPTTAPADLQWATAARASSEYRATDYSAAQATGAPDVAAHGDSSRAWTPKTKDQGEEWLEVTFARAVHATGVRVVQSYHPGAIVRIEAIDGEGRASELWKGPDATAYTKARIGVLDATFPRTTLSVQKVRIVLDTKRGAEWREIDAVGLLGSAQ